METPAPETTGHKPGFRDRIFRHRLPIGLAVVGFAALVVRPRPALGFAHLPVTLGAISLILAGLSLRIWGGGYAGRHTREAKITAPRLVTAGPYAYVRNPIYLGSVVLGAGMVVLVGDPWLFFLYLAVFALLYGAIVPAEEKFLRAKFGPAYQCYCAQVPRTWPRLKPWPEAQPSPFQTGAISGEARLALVLVGIYGLLRLSAWLRL